MGAKKFFKKVGRGVQSGIGEGFRSFSKGIGSVLGPAAGAALLSATPYIVDAAPAVLALKTGGFIKGPRNKAVHVILHGGEHVLPYGVKPTKKQKAIVALNKRKQKIGKFV